MHLQHRLPVVFLALAVLLLVPACSSHHATSNSSSGNVRFVLSAAPAATTASAVSSSTGTTGTTSGDSYDLQSKLAQVNVTFSSLLARNLDGNLINLTIDLPQTVNLIDVINGRQVTLPTGTLPPAMYDQLVVVITNVEFVLNDGTKFDLTPPGGGWTKIIPVQTFEVVEGQTITINLDFNPLHAFGESDGEYQFSPDFGCGGEH